MGGYLSDGWLLLSTLLEVNLRKKLVEGPELPCRNPKNSFTKTSHRVQNKVEEVPWVLKAPDDPLVPDAFRVVEVPEARFVPVVLEATRIPSALLVQEVLEVPEALEVPEVP